MGVWDHLTDFDAIGMLLQHPGHRGVTETVETLLTGVRQAHGRGDLRQVQTDLFGYLLTAEERYAKSRRAAKRGVGGASFEVTFWRRACVQLRTVGDAIAWKFLGYDRRKILLMRRGELAGHFYGKEGTEVEWALFNEHWEAGEPTLLTGLTMCIRHGDLLVDTGSGTLMIIEAKKNLKHTKSSQSRRGKALVETLNSEGVLAGPDGPSQIVQSGLPLITHWPDAVETLGRAEREGVATVVLQPGLAALFMAPLVLANVGLGEGERLMQREREAAAGPMGPVTDDDHTILIHSINYPYKSGPIAPLSILPVPTNLAAQLVTGEIVYSVEVHPHQLAEALQRRGIEARVALPPEHGDLTGQSILEFDRGNAKGVLHSNGIEPVGAELHDFDRWAEGVDTTFVYAEDAKVGTYVCFDEEDVWA